MSSARPGTQHIKAWSRDGGLTFEPCEDPDCVVESNGVASCGRIACPSCNQSGANILGRQEEGFLCTCGNAWRVDGV